MSVTVQLRESYANCFRIYYQNGGICEIGSDIRYI
ncbi:hypothetical protein C5S39_00500 [Candidatus Methanophagaceae archaeon]|nr:hypothetical protein C5S39_00500 [Methanophagales archaeon]